MNEGDSVRLLSKTGTSPESCVCNGTDSLNAKPYRKSPRNVRAPCTEDSAILSSLVTFKQ
jgi:hypothetical protein